MLLFPLTVILSLATSRAAQGSTCIEDHVVRPGETLYAIAREKLGSGRAAGRIAEATERASRIDARYARIVDVDRIMPDWILCIPAAGERSTTTRGTASPTHDSSTGGVSATRDRIMDQTWKLRSIESKVEGSAFVEHQDLYTLEVLPEGQLRIRSDCRLGHGRYVLTENRVQIRITAVTRQECSADSLSERFLASLRRVDGFQIQNRLLTLSFDEQQGHLEFSR